MPPCSCWCPPLAALAAIAAVLPGLLVPVTAQLLPAASMLTPRLHCWLLCAVHLKGFRAPALQQPLAADAIPSPRPPPPTPPHSPLGEL